MRHLFCALGGAVLMASPVVAQDSTARSGICDWILERYAVSASVGGGSATEFLRQRTQLLDIMFGMVSPGTPNAPFQEFYPLAEGAQPVRALELLTRGASDHGACQQVDSHLGSFDLASRGDYREVPNVDGQPVRVSLFAFDNSAALSGASFGPTRTATSLRSAVGRFDFRQEQEDPFATFGVAVLNSADKSKPAVGSVDRNGRSVGLPDTHRWFTADLGQGKQLVAITCFPACSTYLGPLADGPRFDPLGAIAALTTPQTPVAEPATTPPPTDPVPATPDPAPETTQPDPPAQPPVTVAPDFAGEQLFLSTGAAGVLLQSVDLEAAAGPMSAPSRTLVRKYLEDLRDDDAAIRRTALEQLTAAGILKLNPLDWQIKDLQTSHTLLLQPKGPARLNRVELRLASAQRRAVVANCVAKLEISHPDHDTQVLPLFLGNSGKTGGLVSEYNLLFADLADNAALNVPPGDLTLRVFIDDSAGKPSCKLDWLGLFPNTAYNLPAAISPAQVGYFDLSQDGTAVFSDVRLSSTDRPIYLALYNKTGAVDSNGAALAPTAFPAWNAPQSGPDLQEALSIITQISHGVLAGNSAKIYTVMGESQTRKDFGDPEPLTANRVRELLIPTLSGDFGSESLNIAMGAAVGRHDVAPRFVIIGRTGLNPAIDYCRQAPRAPKIAQDGMIVIDFVPEGGFDQLPEETRLAMEAPTGNPGIVDALKRFPAGQCPKSEGSGLDHWVLFPDFKSNVTWRRDLAVLTSYIFGE